MTLQLDVISWNGVYSERWILKVEGQSIVVNFFIRRAVKWSSKQHLFFETHLFWMKIRIWDLLPRSTTYREVACFDVTKRQMTSSFSSQDASDKHWRSISKRCFLLRQCSQNMHQIVFFNQNGGYYRAGNHPRNSQLRFQLKLHAGGSCLRLKEGPCVRLLH